MRRVDKINYRERLIDKKVEHLLNVFGAISIEGPKWCGKTMTSSRHAKSEIFIADSENNFQNRKIAQIKPSRILDGDNPRLIDEWQEVPSLWDAVRMRVDEEEKKGLFILTGSSTPKFKGVYHSGIGRIERVRMDTMTLFETGDSTGEVKLKSILKGEPIESAFKPVELEDLAYYVVRGGWPANLQQERKDAGYIPLSYVRVVLEDEIGRLEGERRFDRRRMSLILKSLARNESTTATQNKIKRDIKEIDEKGIDDDTLAVYLDALRRLFLLRDTPPFSPSVRSSVRVKQLAKRHFSDPSISTAILNLNEEKLCRDLETFGFLFEALVEHDLMQYAEANNAKMYHYQDYKERKIDAVVETEDGAWSAFEIKLGTNSIDEAAAKLVKIKTKIGEEGGIPPQSLVVISGLASAAYQRDDGVYVVPITTLKD